MEKIGNGIQTYNIVVIWVRESKSGSGSGTGKQADYIGDHLVRRNIALRHNK